MVRRLPAILLIATASATAPALAEERWTVSCSENGKVIYRQAMDVPAAEFDTSAVTARYPDAACVFLAPAPAYTAPTIAPGDAGDLDAALRAITGSAPASFAPQSLPIIPAAAAPPADLGLTVEATPAEIPAMAPITSPPRFRPGSPEWVRLATYRTDAVSDALADWAAIAGQEIAFRRLMPSLTRTEDGYITLTAGPVAPGERDGICIAASGYGLDCVWGEGDEEPRADHTASDYLAFLFPDHVMPPGDAQQCPRTDAMSLHGETAMQGRNPGYTCWNSPFATPVRFPAYVPGGAADIGTPDDPGMPPLPRKRPVRAGG